MTKVVNVRFRDAGKPYRFSCDDMTLTIGDAVMVETNLGLDLAHVCVEPYEMEITKDSEETKLLPVLRLATEDEKVRYEKKCRDEQDAYIECVKLIEKHALEMNLVDVVYAFDGKKIIFFFTADGRVDFRELVKDLAFQFHTRIELRQIGSRDQAKHVGGLGICGRQLCCSTFLTKFAPVNLRLARAQGLAINPGKLNGACGRLMCCLQFEKEAYADARSRLPESGRRVRTPAGPGTVADVNYITEKVRIKFTNEEGSSFEEYQWDELEPLNPDVRTHIEEDDDME